MRILVVSTVLLDAARLESTAIVRDLLISSPHAKVVAFGVQEAETEVLALEAAGTAGCVRDSAASGDIVRILERVLRDELCRPPRPMANDHVDIMPLSRREAQIAHLIESGLTNKAIGRQLGIEAATVKNHVHNMCEKLKVHRRGEVAARIRAILGIGTTFETG
jgi:two-component system, NarL family, nitrate/nitrite response regulator NarL